MSRLMIAFALSALLAYITVIEASAIGGPAFPQRKLPQGSIDTGAPELE
nr:venom peptide [Acharia stimulea]